MTQLDNDKVFHVFGIKDCKWCDLALDALYEEDVDYTYYRIDQEPLTDSDEIIGILYKRTGLKTAPQIWHGDKHIGGYEALIQYLRNS